MNINEVHEILQAYNVTVSREAANRKKEACEWLLKVAQEIDKFNIYDNKDKCMEIAKSVRHYGWRAEGELEATDPRHFCESCSGTGFYRKRVNTRVVGRIDIDEYDYTICQCVKRIIDVEEIAK